MSADHSHLHKLKKQNRNTKLNDNQISRRLRQIAEDKKNKLSVHESKDSFLAMVLELPFLSIAEKRLFCLELHFLINDNRFPAVWNRQNIGLLLKIHRPYHPINGLEDLLIPLALKETKGRSFHPLLEELLDKLDKIPLLASQWTLILELLLKETPIIDITGLIAKIDTLGSYQLPQVRQLFLFQINILVYFLENYKQEDKILFSIAFYFIRQAQNSLEQTALISRLIHDFIQEVLPLAEKRLNHFELSLLRNPGKKGVDFGAKKAFDLFQLWLAHQNLHYTYLFVRPAQNISNQAITEYASYLDFCSRRFEQIIRYLPIRWLWNVSELAAQNLELLFHFGAGYNIRSFSGLCLPVPKKMAHAFHQLPPKRCFGKH